MQMKGKFQPALLEARRITKTFPGIKALDDVTLTMLPGEVHAVVGENGAGKSTLMGILSGALTPDSGDIFLYGIKFEFKSPKDAANAGVAIIHQELSLIPSMSVAENIFLGRPPLTKFGNINWKKLYQDAEDLLQDLDLSIDVRKNVEHYPIGLKQMIEIAKALSLNASLIIMDEPTSSLSDTETDRLFEIIKRLKKDDRGVIYITHRLEEIYRISDRVSVLRDGEKVGSGWTNETTITKLIRWMVGRDEESFYKMDTSALDEVVLEAENINLPSDEGLSNIVDNVSLRVRVGEIVGLLGLLGSGNSEVLNILFGSYGNRASGTIKICGKMAKINSPPKAMKHGLALVTNDRKTSGLIMPLSVTKNITLASLKSAMPPWCITDKKEKSLAEPFFKDLSIRVTSPDSEVWTLSGGNQQKVVLAKWLMTDPKIILLDEPTRGIDIGAKSEIYRLMNRWTSQGKAIILITSELPELLAMSDRILVMRKGGINAEFSRDEATPEKVMSAAL